MIPLKPADAELKKLLPLYLGILLAVTIISLFFSRRFHFSSAAEFGNQRDYPANNVATNTRLVIHCGMDSTPPGAFR